MIVSAEGGVSVSEFFEFYLKNKLYRFIRVNVEFEVLRFHGFVRSLKNILQFFSFLSLRDVSSKQHVSFIKAEKQRVEAIEASDHKTQSTRISVLCRPYCT